MKPRDIDIDIAQNKGRDWYQIVRINISSIKTCSYWLFFDSIFLRFMTSFNADSHGETLQEKNLLYKLISGLHSSISIHIAADYLLDETTNLVSTLPCILQQYSLYNFHSLFWISYCFFLEEWKGFSDGSKVVLFIHYWMPALPSSNCPIIQLVWCVGNLTECECNVNLPNFVYFCESCNIWILKSFKQDEFQCMAY